MKWSFYLVEQFEQLAPTWNGLNSQAGGLPFLDTRFVIPLCRIFGDASLKVGLCENSNQPLAMGIFAKRGPMQWETFQPSQSPLGAWVMQPGAELEAILCALLKALPGSTLAIGLTQQDPACIPRPSASSCLHTLDYIQTAWVEIAGQFEDYWRLRGKNLRHNMKRQRAKLAQDGLNPRLEVLTRPEQIASAIEDYGRLESAGWKAAGGTAVHPDNAQGRFYRSMLEAFCEAGAGVVYRYWIADRVVAVDLCIEGGGALVILKTTYDETIKTFSPAFLMREEAFKVLFEEKRIQRVEFFGKMLEWHARWTGESRTLYHVNCYRFGFLPKLRNMASRFGKAAQT